MCFTILIIIICSCRLIIAKRRPVMRKRQLNLCTIERIASLTQIYFCIGKGIVRTLIIFIVFCAVVGAGKFFVQITCADILCKLCWLAIFNPWETTTEIVVIFLFQVGVHMHSWSTVVTENSIPLPCQHNIGRTCASDTAKLCNLSPILYNRHKTCHSAICSTVHNLIHHICLCKPKMRQCFFLIVHHHCNWTLIF